MESNVYDMLEPQREQASREAAELAIYHDRQYKRLQLMIILLSTVTTISAGLGTVSPWLGFRVIAVFASGFATMLLLFQQHFSPKEKSKDYNDLHYQLELAPLRYKANLDAYSQAKSTQEKYDLYYKDITPLISKWRTQRGMQRPQQSSQIVMVKPVENQETVSVVVPKRGISVVATQGVYTPESSIVKRVVAVPTEDMYAPRSTIVRRNFPPNPDVDYPHGVIVVKKQED